MTKVIGTKVESIVSVYGGNNGNRRQRQNKERTFEEFMKIENEKVKSVIMMDLSGSMR